MADVGGDKAAGSPVMIMVLACSKKGTLSSADDETSQDVTSLGEGKGKKPMNMVLITSPCSGKMMYVSKRRHCTMSCLI